MSNNVYLARLKDGNGDIVYPATQTSVVYDENGINIDEKVKHFLHADERIPHIQAGEIDAHTLDGKDLDYIISHAGGVTFDDIPTEGSQNAVRSGGIFNYVAAAKAFSDNPDNVPTENSSKGVTSGGVFNYAAPKVSPSLTGTPTAPTAVESTNTDQIATTQFVQQLKGRYDFGDSTATSFIGEAHPNIQYDFKNPLTSLNVSLRIIDPYHSNEWLFCFIVGDNFTLSVSSHERWAIKWKDGVPTFTPGKYVELSFLMHYDYIIGMVSETDIS